MWKMAQGNDRAGVVVWLSVLLLALGNTIACAGQPAHVSFYECRKCQCPPTLDGRLNDACWQGLPVMRSFYKYWSPVPEPPQLKTTARLTYDQEGLYMGIALYDEHLESIRATVRNRDDPATWQDDCVEIMIDPQNSGTGYFKFSTNFLAARYDEKVVDMNVGGGEWNASGWKVCTSKDELAWYIEFYVPWNDLGVKPGEGDIWSFDLVRYGYSSGAFRGVSWSLGGSYAAPQNFGYLAFGRFLPVDEGTLQRIARTVSRTKGECFSLFLPGLVLTHEPSGKWRKQALRSWAAEPLGEAEGLLSMAEAAAQAVSMAEERKRLVTRAGEIHARMEELRSGIESSEDVSASAASVARQRALDLRQEAAELKWDVLLMELISSL